MSNWSLLSMSNWSLPDNSDNVQLISDNFVQWITTRLFLLLCPVDLYQIIMIIMSDCVARIMSMNQKWEFKKIKSKIDDYSDWPFKPSRCIRASFYIPENRLNFPTGKGVRMKIFTQLFYQYMAFFFNFSPTSNHLHPLQVENCDSNSRLVEGEDNNGKFRNERVNVLYPFTWYTPPLWAYASLTVQMVTRFVQIKQRNLGMIFSFDKLL